ncbi:MAG: hypothetical protein ABSE04_01215 [Candidatus Microgenomates bacterium]|jgi:hypothetical protein
MEKEKLPNPILILILTLITAFIWVSLNIYRAISTKPTASVPQAISQPLTPLLDPNAIKKIQSSILLNSSQIPQNIITPAGTNAPAVLPTLLPVATPIASPSSLPTASPSATP